MSLSLRELKVKPPFAVRTLCDDS
jgi:hypothetical protein